MGHKWIIDVLADLRSFAQANDLALLADQLEQAAKVATAEVTSTVEGASLAARGHDGHIGSVSEGSRGRECA